MAGRYAINKNKTFGKIIIIIIIFVNGSEECVYLCVCKRARAPVFDNAIDSGSDSSAYPVLHPRQPSLFPTLTAYPVIIILRTEVYIYMYLLGAIENEPLLFGLKDSHLSN